jgi:tetrahydromethanopterin S-methyltransferase subunit E
MPFSRSCPVWGISPPSGRVVSVPYEQSEIIVEMIISHEKSCPGFGFVTQFMRWYPARGRNNDTGMMSQCHVTIITCKFPRALVYAVVLRVTVGMSTLVKGFTSVARLSSITIWACHNMGASLTPAG